MPYLETTHFAVVKINTTEGPLNIVSLYFQLSHGIGQYLDQLQKITRETRGQSIIISVDANTHSKVWFSSEDYDRCDEMLGLIARNNLVIINRLYQPSSHKSGTNTNINLCSLNLRDKIQDWMVHEEESLSDIFKFWKVQFKDGRLQTVK